MPSAANDNATPSSSYLLIRKAIQARQQTVFAYDGKRREACPVILGYTRAREEVMFAFQFAGETSSPSRLPEWRCFRLAKVEDLHSRAGPWHEGTSHGQSQTCVQFVDIDVNIPDTLTRSEPLSSSSPLLRPAR
jgi:hypothetical protein